MATIKITINEFKGLHGLPRFVYPLALVTALGLCAGFYRLYVGLGNSTNLNTIFPWGLWISYDLSVVAFSGAAFTLAALVYIFHMHELHPAVRPTVLFGLLGYGSVLVTLFFDLGHWERFWHFLVYPNFSSALFEVSWCIAIYSAILVYEFSPVILDKFKNPGLQALVEKISIPMIIAGITLSSMHQSSLGSLFVVMSPRLHPLWYSVLQPVLFLVSSLSAGLSTIIIGSYVSTWMFGKTLGMKAIEKLSSLMPWFLGFYLALKLGDLFYAAEFDLLFTSGIFGVLYLVEIMIGIIIPVILFSLKKVRQSRTGSLVGALFVAAGIILNRFDMSWFALKQSYGVGYFPSWIETALMVGIISGVVLVFTVVSFFLPVFKETVSTDQTHSAESPNSLPALMSTAEE